MHTLILFLIFVKTCNGKPARIYKDKKFAIPVMNPFIGYSNAIPKFYTPETCTQIVMKEER